MKAIVAVIAVLAVAAAVTIAAPAASVPDTPCRLATPVADVSGVAQLPAALKKLIGPLADAGAPFDSSDDVEDALLPFRRLIRAGYHGDDWFVWYEHGGITYFSQAVVAHVGADGTVSPLANAGTIDDTLCVVTDGAFAGKVPPYPPGSWQANGF
ncbi:hypothetical protein [Mycolicibacterium sphagni]|uniref:hypothetical protein n=1 Tax=Mycolicibacterium sphagni TaxID=1786 RepID=UPI001F3FC426|nr:hypothetical protein [Mycolicibacterium sphagni]